MHEEQLLLEDQQHIWPGSIIRGSSLKTGNFTPIALPREPLTFSISLPMAGDVSKTVDNPTRSNVLAAISELLHDNAPTATPFEAQYKIEDYYSQEQLDLSLGISYKGSFDLEANFDFSDNEVASRKLFMFTQVYYTLDIDPPSSSSAFFSPSLTLEDVKHEIDEDEVPLYVSSIKYGRTAFFSVESHLSETEVQAGLEAAYGGIKGTVNIGWEQTIDNSKIYVKIRGGSGISQFITTFEDMKEWAVAESNFSVHTGAVPLAYTLSCLCCRTPQKVVFTAAYSENNCNQGGTRWLGWFSDGWDPAHRECLPGNQQVSPMTGIKCRGSFCDDINVQCYTSFPFIYNNSWWTDEFSEEGSGNGYCDGYGDTGFVVGMWCWGGSYCDDIKLRCATVPGYMTKNCQLDTDFYLSDEDASDNKPPLKNEYLVPRGKVIKGVTCSGSNCDNKQFDVCDFVKVPD